MDPQESLAARTFRTEFGGEATAVCLAPGRINLIGEHTDYSDGFVFPAAIDRTLIVAGRLATGNETKLISVELGKGEQFEANSVLPGSVHGWAAYPAGMAWALQSATGKPMPNLEAAVHSTIPVSSGVSSSAALELAFGVLWNHLAELGLSNFELALLAQKCENQFVGVNSGIMDQMASAMGKVDQAMFLDTRTLELGYAAIPEGLVTVICDTQKPRALTSSAYNERRAQCEEACRILRVPTLRDATEEMLENNKSLLGDVIYRRARHVVTENQRCLLFKEALATGNRLTIGALMRASHESLRDDFEVSCLELDAMASACWKAPGCVGARMMGAGFGGACISLVERKHEFAFRSQVTDRYEFDTDRIGRLIVCNIVDGARILR